MLPTERSPLANSRVRENFHITKVFPQTYNISLLIIFEIKKKKKKEGQSFRELPPSPPFPPPKRYSSFSSREELDVSRKSGSRFAARLVTGRRKGKGGKESDGGR